MEFRLRSLGFMFGVCNIFTLIFPNQRDIVRRIRGELLHGLDLYIFIGKYT